MSTPEIQVRARTVHIDERRSVVLVPSVRVTVSGEEAEVAGYLNIVMARSGDGAVHYYTVLVESWTVGTRAEELRRKIERVLTKANEAAEKYAEALELLRSLGVEISFRGNLAAREELPAWLRKHLPP
jgi:hypothetical protein